MKLRDQANTGMLMFGVGVLAGVVLIAFLPGMPWVSTVRDTTGDLDLGAQRSMASAAWWMVVLTALAGFVGTISLWLIRENLLAAREINRHAERSAKAAEDAVGAANRTADSSLLMGQAQVRCYLVVKSAALELYSVGTTKLQFFMLNSGQTPAKVVSVSTAVWLEFKREDGSWEAGQQAFTEQKTRSDIPGQEERSGRSEAMQFFSEETLQRTQEADTRILVDITLSFTDVFGVKFEETAFYGVQPKNRSAVYNKHTLYRIHR